MGATSALKLREIAENLERIIALELFSAAQAIDLRKKRIGEDKILGKGTREIYKKIREIVPFIEEDTVMYPHIEKVKSLIKKDFGKAV